MNQKIILNFEDKCLKLSLGMDCRKGASGCRDHSFEKATLPIHLMNKLRKISIICILQSLLMVIAMRACFSSGTFFYFKAAPNLLICSIVTFES